MKTIEPVAVHESRASSASSRYRHFGRRRREADPRALRQVAEASGSFPDAGRLRQRRPDDYIAGFPDHPHRGFETVTYMLSVACGIVTAQDTKGCWITAGCSG